MNSLENLQTLNSAESANEILCAALDLGEHILRNGGEIHRVEDTIERVCNHFGAAHVEVFAIPTLIISSVRLKNGDFSHQIRRIKDTGNNLSLLEDLNSISRRLCAGEIKLSEVRPEILAAKGKKVYPKWVLGVSNMFAAGGFAVFFGGTLIDGLVAAVIGILMMAFSYLLPKYINKMISILVSATFGGLLAVFSSKLGLCENLDMVMIGTVMLLIPGVAISNAIRDMLGGEAISGALELLQALLLALMIAAGYAIALLLI